MSVKKIDVSYDNLQVVFYIFFLCFAARMVYIQLLKCFYLKWFAESHQLSRYNAHITAGLSKQSVADMRNVFMQNYREISEQNNINNTLPFVYILVLNHTQRTLIGPDKKAYNEKLGSKFGCDGTKTIRLGKTANVGVNSRIKQHCNTYATQNVHVEVLFPHVLESHLESAALKYADTHKIARADDWFVLTEENYQKLLKYCYEESERLWKISQEYANVHQKCKLEN